MSTAAWQECINPDCRATYDISQVLHGCTKCGNLLDAAYDWDRLPVPKSLKEFERRWSNRRNPIDFSGVWRFRELMPFVPEGKIVSIGEGQTQLRQSAVVADYIGVDPSRLFLQYEGMNFSGSFKDNGMTGAFTHAKLVGARRVACASTGNTSASMALFAAAMGGIKAYVFIGSGKIAFGKLSQALDYGGITIQIEGDFDDAMERVQQVSSQLGIYLMNSVNPFRLEGQKAIMYRVLEGLGWEPPDWIVVPGGNLGNSSAFGKAFIELKQLGLITKVPRVAIINSTGARTLSELVNARGLKWNGGHVDDGIINDYYAYLDEHKIRAVTLASAIEINRPVNLKKALRTLAFTDGVVREATDEEILDAKAKVGQAGIGCEPASAASVAGARRLREQGLIQNGETVVCILTGHQLKDPDVTVNYHSAQGDAFAQAFAKYGVDNARFRNMPVKVQNDLGKIIGIVERNDE
ncbi:MAG TPA: threonine synthase [Planctomycetota bacterium]|nr:threonine synthase [Planctomycetota bacterium]